jgi:hypothetical protein
VSTPTGCACCPTADDCEPADLEDEFDHVGDLLQIADPLTVRSLRGRFEGLVLEGLVLENLVLEGLVEEFTERLDGAVGLAGQMPLTLLPA